MRSERELDGVTLLGSGGTQYVTTYSPEILEKFPNKHPENDYMVTLSNAVALDNTMTPRFSSSPT